MGDVTDNLDSRNVSDLRMMAKAITEGYAMTAEKRRKIVQTMHDVLADDEAPFRAKTTAGKLLVEIDKFVHDVAKQEAGQPDAVYQHNVSVSPDLSKLNYEELTNLRNALKPLGK